MRARIGLIGLDELFVPAVVVPAPAQTAAILGGTVEDQNRSVRAGVTLAA